MICTVDGCDTAASRPRVGLCEKHFYRMRRKGSTDDERRDPWIAGYCKRCGDAFVARYRSAQFCSQTCKGRHDAANYNHRQRKAKVREAINVRDLAERDGWRCHLCKGKVTQSNWSIDHLIPLSAGGDHVYLNVALAHANCNKRRGHRGPAQLLLVG
jgi:5-methylcytosine-specific restriction endonuclease McrA